MADSSRTIKAKFDGDTTGLGRAAKRGEDIVEKFGRDASRKMSGGFDKEHKGRGLQTFIGAGVSSAQGFAASLTVGVRNMHGPIMAALAAAIVVGAPAVGALAAGGIVSAFGLGLIGLGLAVTKNSPAVVASMERLKTEVTTKIKQIAKPFEDTWLLIVSQARRAFNKFAPVLEDAFKKLAPITAMLSGSLFRALEQLAPVIGPVVDAFAAIAATLEPAIPQMIGGIATGLAAIAKSVKENPNALADFFAGMGDLLNQTLQLVADLNDLNGEIENLTGGFSGVDMLMTSVVGGIYLLRGAVYSLTQFVRGLKKAWDAVAGIFRKKHTATVTGNGSF